ncbi:RHS repeat domain-containing protein [Dysgonomonas reticulitermitis]
MNKGITEIQYNSLNLPKQMVINSSSVKAKNYYTYSASGVKLRTEQRYDPTLQLSPVQTTTPATDGFTDYKNTDYVGNIIYETEKKGAAVTNKTRILVDGGYIENNVYHYYLTDHLGNNRMTVNQNGVKTQWNHYYPFGTIFADKYTYGSNQHPYKYNGKELDQMHGLNLYDYSARYYESAIGRFTTVDPLAEKHFSVSPYVYALNNPMRYIDPLGTDTVPANEVWEYYLTNYRTDGMSGLFDKNDYEVVTNEDGEVFNLHLITSGENEGNYMAIQQYGKTEDGYDIYEYQYIVGKDKVNDFKKGETEGSGYLRGAVKAATDGGFDGRKSNLENAKDYVLRQLHPLNIIFGAGTRNPWNLNDYKSVIRFGGKNIGKSTTKSIVNSMKRGTVTPPKISNPRGTVSHPLKNKDIKQRLKNR